MDSLTTGIRSRSDLSAFHPADQELERQHYGRRLYELMTIGISTIGWTEAEQEFAEAWRNVPKWGPTKLRDGAERVTYQEVLRSGP